MKQQIVKASILMASALLIAACSKEQQEPGQNTQTQGIVFSMSEAPYNDDVDIATRANTIEPLKDTIYWNGVEAEVTLERDNEPSESATRAISSGNHYTIVAFKAGTAQKVGETKGHFDTTTGRFIYDADSDMLRIPAGNYDFVCYTHQYATRSGNTVTVELTNADKAFVCRQTNVAISNVKRQEVTFTMKHAGARVRTKIAAYVAPTGVNATLGYQANQVPASTAYDMLTGTFSASAVKSSSAATQAQNYDIAGTQHDAALNDDLSTVTGNQYITVLPGTKPEELVYQITAGTVYNATINTNGTRKPKATGAFEANGAYSLTIRLIPRFQYLFEDGIAGYLNAADRQGHTAIALVFAPHKAISLWNANGGAIVQWDPTPLQYVNSKTYTWYTRLTDPTSGHVFTWEKNFGGQAKAKVPRFAAYYAAGNFYNSAELTSKATLTGANINKDEAWYLPSAYEWKELCFMLSFTNNVMTTPIGEGLIWRNARMVERLFTAANGTPLIEDNQYFTYWSTSEYAKHLVCTVETDGLQWGAFNGLPKSLRCTVRPFVVF